jgi:DUF1680 family protein
MIGALPEFIYSVADDGVYVDLFAASSVDIGTSSGKMTLNMETVFPYDNKVTITVNAEKPAVSKIRIRVPSWASGNMDVLVNGRKSVTGKPGTYVSLSQTWKNGDKITFQLPAGFRLEKYEGEEKFADRDRYALEYGPVLMALVNIKGDKDNLALNIDPKKFIKSLKPVPGKPLHYIVEGKPDFEYYPYFEVQDQPFSCFP